MIEEPVLVVIEARQGQEANDEWAEAWLWPLSSPHPVRFAIHVSRKLNRPILRFGDVLQRITGEGLIHWWRAPTDPEWRGKKKPAISTVLDLREDPIEIAEMIRTTPRWVLGG